MRELNSIETRNVAGAIYQPEPGTTSSETRRNPLYVYWNATDASRDPLTGVSERL